MQLQVFRYANACVILSIVVHFVGGQNFYYPIDTEKYENSPCETNGGFDGICRKIENCSKTAQQILRSDICSFDGNDAIYCCPIDIEPSSTSDTLLGFEGFREIQDIVADSVRIANLKHLRPAAVSCEKFYPKISLEEFFVEGIRSEANAHPHMAAVGWTNSDGKVDWKCGGSIITEQFIITAAHCTQSKGISPDIISSGDLNLMIEEESLSVQNYNVTSIYTHPDYKTNEIYHDIGLLKFSPEFDIVYPSRRPACLWTTPEIPVTVLLGMGYGTTKFAGPISYELFEGNLSIVPQEECSRRLPANRDLSMGIISGQLCAQDPEHKQDTCQGDSGGPLQFYEGFWVNSRPYIVGITSFGQYCAGTTPGVYTRITSYLDWIESIVWPNTNST